jgi:DNA-binding MarR family transcriptional regulator
MDELIDLLGDVSRGFMVELQQLPALRDFGLTHYQARLLVIVGRWPGCSQRELAGWTGRDKAQVARTIKEIETQGLLERSAHVSDWRSHRLTLSAAGERTVELLARERNTLGDVITQDLSPEERQAMIAGLQKMNARLGVIYAGPDGL